MSRATQSRSPQRRNTRMLVLALIALPLLTAEYAAAQVHGIPPSVTSIQFHTPPFMPNIRPSVTSLGPYGYGRSYPVNGPYRGRNGYTYRNGYGYSTGAYIEPYYIPSYDTSYEYDTGSGGSYVYSVPPTDQTLHIVVDLPPAKRRVVEYDEDGPPPVIASKSNPDKDVTAARDARPIDPTVLVFRDGHHQEVTNYAIMGQTVYVFDNRTQKIALTDLDVAATIKLNDDRGVDFHVPAHTKS